MRRRTYEHTSKKLPRGHSPNAWRKICSRSKRKPVRRIRKQLRRRQRTSTLLCYFLGRSEFSSRARTAPFANLHFLAYPFDSRRQRVYELGKLIDKQA